MPAGDQIYATLDNGIHLHVTCHMPDTGQFPGPKYPYIGTLHASVFKIGDPGPAPVSIMFSTIGFVGCDVEYRLAPPHQPMNTPSGNPPGNHDYPGQDTVGDDGYFPEQHNDIARFVVWARSQPDCDGRVLLAGGSGGASIGLLATCLGRVDDDGSPFYGLASGAVGDTHVDACVVCSGINNHADPNWWGLDCNIAPDVACPSDATANYLNIPNVAPATPTGDDLALCKLASPVTFLRRSLPPLYCAISSKDSLGIPTSMGKNIASTDKRGNQLLVEDGSNGLYPNLLTAGLIEIPSTDPPASGKFSFDIVPVLHHAHAFEYFDVPWSTPPHWGASSVLPWLKLFLDNNPPGGGNGGGGDDGGGDDGGGDGGGGPIVTVTPPVTITPTQTFDTYSSEITPAQPARHAAQPPLPPAHVEQFKVVVPRVFGATTATATWLKPLPNT